MRSNKFKYQRIVCHRANLLQCKNTNSPAECKGLSECCPNYTSKALWKKRRHLPLPLLMLSAACGKIDLEGIEETRTYYCTDFSKIEVNDGLSVTVSDSAQSFFQQQPIYQVYKQRPSSEMRRGSFSMSLSSSKLPITRALSIYGIALPACQIIAIFAKYAIKATNGSIQMDRRPAGMGYGRTDRRTDRLSAR